MTSGRPWQYGKLLVALLVEKLIGHAIAVSPWGYRLAAASAAQRLASAVAVFDRLQGSLVVVDLDKRKAARVAREAVAHERERIQLNALLGKEGFDVRLRRGVR